MVQPNDVSHSREPREEMIEEAVGGAVAVVGEATLAAITRGEIDVQIATAHRFPRSLTAAKEMAIAMATLDEETAESCIYCRPVGRRRDGTVEYAEGPSVRLAEIIGACYGNLRVGSMLIEQTERQVVARGFAHDLERNFASTSEVVESTVTSDGRPFSERMRVVVAKAALAKARRDATFQVVPRALIKPIERAVRALIAGDGTQASMTRRREAVLTWIHRLGIDEARVFAALGVQGIDDVGVRELEILTGIKTALRDKEITIDEAFPPVPIAPPPAAEADAKPKTFGFRKRPARERHEDAPSNEATPLPPEQP